jgi:hypothetical protein
VKAGIRRPAILFAILSSIYWFLVSDLIGVASPLGGFGQQPYWKVALASVIPAVLYAIATLYFCHWLVRRALRGAARKEGE